MEAFPAIPAENMQYYDFPERFANFVRDNPQRLDKDRPICRDSICLNYIIAIGGFFGYGGFIINLARSSSVPYIGTSINIFDTDLYRKQIGISVGMFGLSIIISIAFIVLLRCHPLAGLWTLIAISLGSLAGILIVSFYYGLTAPGIVVGVLLAILIMCVICYSQKINTMGTVLQTITIFLQERKKIFIVSFVLGLLGLCFVVFWLISYYCMYSLNIMGVTADSSYTTGFVFWILLGVLWTFWFYYAVVYIVGAETSLWFYNSELTPIITPIKWLFQGNLGSVTFGAMILAVLKAIDIVLSISVKGRNDRQQSIANTIFKCCVCMFQCCLRSLYTTIKILNNYNMIVTSMTGQSYLDSYKLTGYLILKNFQLFELLKLTSYFVYIGGIVASSGIPTFIGIYLLNRQPIPNYMIITGGAIIFFLSLLTALIVFSTLMQAVSSMFVIFSFQKEAATLGHKINRVLPKQNQLQEYYRNTFSGQINQSGINPQIISNQNFGNEMYNYNANTYPQPYNQNQRYSQNQEVVNNNNGPNFPLGYPL